MAQAENAMGDLWRNFIDEDWLALRAETALDPDLPIVDPHHHLWLPPRPQFDIAELRAAMTCGHNVRATVHLETVTGYRTDGPEHLRAVGETEFVTRTAEQFAAPPGAPQPLAGIIGHADLLLGAPVQDVLEAHIEAGHGRFRGIRTALHWDDNIDMGYPGLRPGTSATPAYRAGLARLAPLNLSCDVFAYFTNLPEVAELTRAFPETQFVLNHCGGPLGLPPYADRARDTFEQWRRNLRLFAGQDNVFMKLGGLGGPFFGPLLPHHLRGRPKPASSAELADLMRPYIEECITAFGPRRCMFESNFPVDKYDCSYLVLWNAFKRLAAGHSADDKRALFSGAAAQVYRLDI